MPTHIKCPNCATDIDVDSVLSTELEQKLKLEYDARQQEVFQKLHAEKKRLEEEQKLFEEKKKKENELFAQKLQLEKQKLEADLKLQIKKSVSEDYENEMKLLKEVMVDNEEKLKLARQKELEFMKKEQDLKTKEKELEIELQKRLMQEREKLQENLKKEESELMKLKETEFLMKLQEKDKLLEDQKKLVDEMKRKQEQGSMQLQGEVQELLLEELLRDHFPYDEVKPVGKGVEGADCFLTVRNHSGSDCGKVIFESKRAKNFSPAWIEKLKNDMRSTNADVAILVTQVYPKEMKCFGEKDGVWICSFNEVIALTTALRHTIIRVADTKKSEENKGEKMHLLYNYLTGLEFRQHIETIVEGFISLKHSITKERIQMEKLWKEREKQLEKVLLSTAGMYGSVKGIAGSSINNIPLLETENEEENGLLN